MKPNDFSQLKVLTPADFSHRSPVREERHPNSVTAPPVNRGSMTPRPWRGFWNSIGTALLLIDPALRHDDRASEPRHRQPNVPRMIELEPNHQNSIETL